jgi:ABC-type polysaccharide/polyol phosphate export permease
LKELRTRYKKSVLGWAWSLLNPLSQMVIFSIIFTYIFKAKPLAGDPSGLKNFPLYFLSGLLPYNFFAITVGVSIGTVQGGAGLIKKVQFPHEHLVFSVVIAQFATLLIELGLLTVAMLVVGHNVLPWLPIMLLVAVLFAFFTAGVAMALAAFNVFYHDVNYLWTILSQVLFYATPVIYFPASLELAALRAVANYGPTGTFITAAHQIMYDNVIPNPLRIAQLVVLGFGTFALGAYIFGRLSPRFAEEM